jgi:enamine deaminase RidA (YjgF/YER057c/UK114 family)
LQQGIEGYAQKQYKFSNGTWDQTLVSITIADQVGVDYKTGKIPSSHKEQVQLALENLCECLESVGATPANFINLTHYVVNIDTNDSSRSRSELLVKFVGGHRPPGTLVGTTALAHSGLSYEIQAMAIVETKRNTK